ncbi:uncharacterized protein LOC127534860 [Acanthochromis polyacanthus]|uniref:uncharacterized protein LOC127534860 n=1 Tax=Acanthochromis polyacanthus TaxID=80966 RepID=UPI0022340BDD|nr:uncharacterized protein LOC127534860 [Acanthochromis polyacanthus]
MDELCDFLRSRNVSEETIQHLEKDKIDSSVILLMTDEQLKEYLPSYGDRLAVLGFCRQKGNNSVSRKSKLFERLRAKISRNRSDGHEHQSEQEPPRNAQKNVRKVEIGWMHFREGKFLQVRTKKGGGTRKISISKNCKKSELIEKAVDLFFPGQKNAEGSITDFVVDVTDFQEHSLDEQITVGQLYEQTKLPLLRFYLTTKKKDISIDTQPVNSSGTAAQDFENMEQTSSSTHHNPSTTLVEAEVPNTVDVIYVESSNALLDISSNDVSLLYPNADMNDLSSVQEFEGAVSVDVLEDSGTVTFSTGHVSVMDSVSLDDTLPLSLPSYGSVHSLHTLICYRSPLLRGREQRKLLFFIVDRSLKNLFHIFVMKMSC